MSSLTASEPVPSAADPHGPAPAILIEDVSVCYRVPRERLTSFKEYAIRALQRRVRHDELWALRDVDLEIRRGELFGVIGRNGAGKSTLLKVISRVLRPTRGRVRVWGRPAPLLELGAGFHPELTGRENVFLNGALLGRSRAEIEAQFEAIVDFAELWEFVDAPLRTYSTGMMARLGFAVATAIRPEILIVDEVLSVGDQQFQQKCLARMREFRERGATILLVSHNMELVQGLCERAAWLHHGELRALGSAVEVVGRYQTSHE
jgi:ABC-type polysaccharide/polyol phosphate transport system ATPase subunit